MGTIISIILFFAVIGWIMSIFENPDKKLNREYKKSQIAKEKRLGKKKKRTGVTIKRF